MKKIHPAFVVLALVFFLSITIGRAEALSLAPGYDLFSTKKGSFIFVDIDGPGFGLDPIRVELEGSPIHASLYNTDTIIQRKAGTSDPFDPGDSEIIPIEIVALSLHSAEPIIVGITPFNVDFRSGSLFSNPSSPYFISPTVPSNPNGTSDIQKINPTGGTFDSFFDIFFEIELKEVGNPSNTQSFFEQHQWHIDQNLWSHLPDPEYPDLTDFPSGNFYAQDVQVDSEDGQILLAAAQTPEPASLILMASGLAGLFGFRKRSRR